MPGAPFRMNVEPSAVRQFAHAVRATDPVHYGEQPLSTPTFLMSSAWWQGPENSPWGDQKRELSRVLHGEQEFVFHGEPPTAGAELEAVARVDRTYTKQGRRGGDMTFTEVVTEFRDARDGRLVAEVRSTTIETGRAVTDEGAGTGGGAGTAAGSEESR